MQLKVGMADAGAGVTWVAGGWATFAHVNEILQFIALVVAIASGIAAGLYHYSEWKKRKDS